MSFNPANFPWTDPITAGTARAVVAAQESPAEAVRCAQELHEAACRFELRGQTNNSYTCRDIASKLLKFGSFASDRQRGYAVQLIAWSKPKQEDVAVRRDDRTPLAICPAPEQGPAATRLPKLHTLLQRLSKLVIGDITIARKNQDSLCWIKLEGIDGVVGRIVDGGVVTLFAKCQDKPALLSRLASIEEDPEAAAVRHGKASGRCSVCNRDLTDPESIERGIGPICAGKF